MKQVEPKVYLLGKTQIYDPDAMDWLNDLGATDYAPQVNEGEGAGLIAMAAKRCYMSFQPNLNLNVKKVRTELADYIDNILKSGHGSVLEHVTYNFALENVSRVFTAEMNRHRAGMAISEGSLRYIRFEDLHYWVPDLFQDAEGDDELTLRKKAKSRQLFESVFAHAEAAYKELGIVWDIDNLAKFHEKKLLTSAFRRIIPMGCATGGVWSGNIRALRHIFTMRCDVSAEEEIRLVASKMLNIMIAQEPLLFGDFYFDEEDQAWRPKFRKV